MVNIFRIIVIDSPLGYLLLDGETEEKDSVYLLAIY
jgi:hypothetical protein